MRRLLAAGLLAVASSAHAEPRSYAAADFRAAATVPLAGAYEYAGFDVYGGQRLLRWLALEGFYIADIGNGAYDYPASCAGICCGSHLRSWNMQELGARVAFVPLHSRFVDLSAGFGIAGVLAHETSLPSREVPTSLGCGGAFYGFHGGVSASTFVSFEVRPLAHLGLRAAGTFGVADVSDFLMFQFSVGPVVWF